MKQNTIVAELLLWTMGQYGDSGEEVSLNTDRILRNWGPIQTKGHRSTVCIDKTPISKNEVSNYRYVRARVTAFSL